MPRHSQPEPPPTFLVDRSLGRYAVPEALRAAGHVVITLAEHLGSEQAAQEAADIDWLDSIAGRDDLVVLTSDHNIRRNPEEQAALRRGGQRLFVPHSKKLTGSQCGVLYVENANRIVQYARKPGPYVVRVAPAGLDRIWPDPTT